MEEAVKLLVIGAGASGLAAGKYALQYGIKSMLVLQKHPDMGGLWNPNTGFTWKNMTTNVSSFNCAYTDYPWPPGSPVFPLASELCDYMKNYSDHFGVTSHIRFNCEVIEVKETQDGKFSITWIDHGSSQKKQALKKTVSVIAESVIVASGMFAEPNQDYNISGLNQFSGSVIHSANYKVPEQFKDKRVLTVGGSISGVQISSDVSQSASFVLHQFNKPFFVFKHFQNVDIPSKRQGYKLVKKAVPSDLFGKSRVHLLSAPGKSYHELVREKNQKIGRACLRQSKIEQIGFSDKDFDRVMYVCISSHYVDSVLQKKVTPKKSRIREFKKNSVVFADGTQVEIDSVIMCTGYKNPMKFLSAHIRQAIQHLQTDNRQSGILYNNILTPKLPNMYFLGQYKGNVVPAVQIQAKYAVRLICHKFELPPAPKMLEAMNDQRFLRNLEDQPQSINHNHVPYIDKLSLQMGENNDLEKLRRQNEELFKKYVKLPSIHNERAFTLDDLEHTIQQIEDLMDNLEDSTCEFQN